MDKLKKGDKFVVIEGQHKRNGIFTFIQKIGRTIIATRDGKKVGIFIKQNTKICTYKPKPLLMFL